jgi:four helix bundle protein
MDDREKDFRVQFKARTKNFALRVLNLFQKMPKTDEAKIIGKQIFCSATSLASNYRATLRARSRKEFISKLGIVIEEADESLFWLELLNEGKIMLSNLLEDLKNEANEIVAVLAKSRATAIRNLKLKK